MTLARRLLLPLLALLAGGPAAAVDLAAQGSSPPVTAAVVIVRPGIAAQVLQELRFGTLAVGGIGDVTPGPAAVGALTSSAGWLFSGVKKKETVVWQLFLPSALRKGASQLPLQWDNAGYGTLCVSRNAGACLISRTFNPGTETTGSVNLPNSLQGNNFDVTVYVGGRAVVPQVPPGVYTAQVTLTLAYLN